MDLSKINTAVDFTSYMSPPSHQANDLLVNTNSQVEKLTSTNSQVNNNVEIKNDVTTYDNKDSEKLDGVFKDINEKIFNTNKSLTYSIHKRTKLILVKLIDKTTNEVLKEFPPENNLDFLANILERNGIIVDEKK